MGLRTPAVRGVVADLTGGYAVIALLAAGDPVAIKVVAEAGKAIGRHLAAFVNIRS